MNNTQRLWRVTSLLAILLLALPLSIPPPVIGADHGSQSFPFMQPDEETFQEWMRAYESAPRMETTHRAAAAPGEGTSVDLLPHLDYVPSERSQGWCGNCWAWADTGCMEIAMDVQEDIFERLSIQYINSCQTPITGNPCCDGGWLAYDFVPFYEATGMCVPWSNANAQWQDASASCSVPCSSIATEPHYEVLSIDDLTVPTHSSEGVPDDETAAANIRSALDQGRAIWFAFFVPTRTAWSAFESFWQFQSEDTVINLDAVCSGTSRYVGHAVLCVGYNDEDPENRYWVMLNSWGTASGRPNGLFRINMDMDYNASCGWASSFYWQTLDVVFSPPPPPVVTTSPAGSVEATTAQLNGTLVDDGGEECDCRFEYATESGVPYAFSTAWQSGLTEGQSFQADIDTLLPGTRYCFRAQARNFGGTSSGEEEVFLTKPLPPEQFSASATGQDAVELSWSHGAGADTTVVRGKKETPPSGPEDGYAVHDGTGTSCTDTELDPGSKYYYRAWSIADDDALDSMWSDDSAQDCAHTIGNGVWMVGDVNLDGRVTMADVAFVMQYRAGLREFNTDQMRCADTNADSRVTMADALHIMQFRADPDGSLGILHKPLYDPVFHHDLLDPLVPCGT